MGIKLNLTGEEIKGAQGNNFAPLAEGTYSATIFDAKFKQSRAGNDMYELTFKITDGPEGVGRQLRGWFTLTAKALFKVVELNKAVGFPYPNKETPAGEFEFNDADDYLGIEVNLIVIQEPYEGVEEDTDPKSPTFGEEVDATLFRNNIKKVLKHDPSKVTSEGSVKEEKTGLFL